MNNLANCAAIASLLTGLALAQTAARPQTSVDPSRQPMLVKFQDLKWQKLWDQPCNDKGEYTQNAFTHNEHVTEATNLMISKPEKFYIRRQLHTVIKKIYVCT